ncbi:hypothetical protein ACFSO7_20820 [Bacillus sp. CGMCC 1.16607]|uniref:hypothetical protein n=1 Tax=Bacillus sp. CGMCC 1.16607 TaxID=3351842 RepID=UPI00363E29C8
MIEIVKGNVIDLKVEMKQAHKTTSLAVTALKKPYKKMGYIPSHIQTKVDELTSKIEMYSVSKTLPVRIEGVVINLKVFEVFMKKLNGFEKSIIFQSDGLTVQYWKKGYLSQGKGLLKLYDLSKYFDGFEHILEGKERNPYGQEA